MKIDVQEFRKPCACGRTHEIVVDDMIIEKGAIQRLPHIMKHITVNTKRLPCCAMTIRMQRQESS